MGDLSPPFLIFKIPILTTTSVSQTQYFNFNDDTGRRLLIRIIRSIMKKYEYEYGIWTFCHNTLYASHVLELIVSLKSG